MSIVPNREQRRANRRPSFSKVVLTGLLFGIVIYASGVVGLAHDVSIVHAIVLALALTITLGAMSLFFRSRDRKSAT